MQRNLLRLPDTRSCLYHISRASPFCCAVWYRTFVQSRPRLLCAAHPLEQGILYSSLMAQDPVDARDGSSAASIPQTVVSLHGASAHSAAADVTDAAATRRSARETGLRIDGRTPDKRTTLGRAMLSDTADFMAASSSLSRLPTRESTGIRVDAEHEGYRAENPGAVCTIDADAPSSSATADEASVAMRALVQVGTRGGGWRAGSSNSHAPYACACKFSLS